MAVMGDTPEKKQKYLDDYKEHEGVDLSSGIGYFVYWFYANEFENKILMNS